MTFGIVPSGGKVTLKGIGSTAFGELPVAQPTPVVQMQWPYNVNARIVESRPNQSGSLSVSNNMLHLQTGAAANSSQTALSVRPLAYRPGQGALVRFTGVFTTGVADSVQYVGIGDAGDGLFFGYNGAAFGVMRRQGGAPEIRTLTISTPAGEVDSITITLDGDTKAVAVTNAGGDKTVTVAEIAAEDYSDTGRGWTAFADNDTVVFVSWDASARTGTYDLTDATAAAGTFAQTVAGVAPTETFTAQTSWSDDNADGKAALPVLDPTKGNVYQIRFQWLGFGAVEFFVEDPATGEFVLVNRVEYANANTIPIIDNPSLPLCATVENVANTSDLDLHIGSMGGFVEGEVGFNGPTASASGLNAAVAAVDVPVLSLRNNSVFQGRLNRTIVNLRNLSVAADATKTLTFTVILNPTLVGEVFSDVDATNSVVSSDSTATALTGGTVLGDLTVSKTGSQVLMLDFDLLPGKTITIAAAAASGTGHDATATAGWQEQF